jgi:hypothetical protein
MSALRSIDYSFSLIVTLFKPLIFHSTSMGFDPYFAFNPGKKKLRLHVSNLMGDKNGT